MTCSLAKRRSYKRLPHCTGLSTCRIALAGDVHITSNSRIPVDPPGASDASLPVEQAELIEAEFLLQATCHGNARFASAEDDDGIVSIGIFIISVNDMNRIREVCH